MARIDPNHIVVGAPDDKKLEREFKRLQKWARKNALRTHKAIEKAHERAAKSKLMFD